MSTGLGLSHVSSRLTESAVRHVSRVAESKKTARSAEEPAASVVGGVGGDRAQLSAHGLRLARSQQGAARLGRLAATPVSQPQCSACAERKYQDGSDDPTVSFQSPTAVSPEAAFSAVNAHEAEHVRHEASRASQEGREVVSQHVLIRTGICSECGRMYISGGETVTVTQSAASRPAKFDVGGSLDLRG